MRSGSLFAVDNPSSTYAMWKNTKTSVLTKESFDAGLMAWRDREAEVDSDGLLVDGYDKLWAVMMVESRMRLWDDDDGARALWIAVGLPVPKSVP